MARPGDPQEMDERAVVRKIGDAETIRFAADNGDGAALLSLGVWEVVRQAMEEERGFFGAVYAVGGSREYQIWHAFDIAGVDPDRWYPTLYDADGNAFGLDGWNAQDEDEAVDLRSMRAFVQEVELEADHARGAHRARVEPDCPSCETAEAQESLEHRHAPSRT